jgi:hypothetical protein
MSKAVWILVYVYTGHPGFVDGTWQDMKNYPVQADCEREAALKNAKIRDGLLPAETSRDRAFCEERTR